MSAPSTAGPSTSSNKAFLLVVVGVIVIGLFGVALFAAGRGGSGDGDDDSPIVEQTAAVELTGDALPPMPDGLPVATAANDPVAGSVAPSLVASDFEGNGVTIGADGRAKAVYFLAHWCSHCQAEVPLVQELIDDGAKPDALDVYAVSTAVDEDSGNYPPQTWFESEGFAPTTVRDDASSGAFSAFGGSGFPYVVYLDGDNRVVARSAGSLGRDEILELWSAAAAG